MSPATYPATPHFAAPAPCTEALAAAAPVFESRLATAGTTTTTATVVLGAGHEWFIEAVEQGNDALLEVRGPAGRLLARADRPERRSGARRAILGTPDAVTITLRLVGKEHAGVSGTATLRVVEASSLQARPECIETLRLLAAADSDYADGQQISLGRVSGVHPVSRHSYLRAAEGYRAALQSAGATADAPLRGEAALALAGVLHFDLQYWERSAAASEVAERAFADGDAYREARAQALAAVASIELASRAKSDATDREHPAAPLEQIARARARLERLAAFHTARHETYDAALQVNNVALSYLYEGSYVKCAESALSASRMFAAVGETPRQAIAWQNRALCFWGLGHLEDAQTAFNEALSRLGPEPYPQLYVLTLNNTALVNYALGLFDESLRLHDRALAFAVHSQNHRAESQSLYGIGVTYYALGNRELARDYLERARTIRTVATDIRGRMAVLRSLATIYAEAGDRRHAIELDHEALAIATAPFARARINIQLAAHTADDGRPDEALGILADLLAPRATDDPLIHAQALIARATIERTTGAGAAALVDLGVALPAIRRLHSPSDEFAAELECARVLRAAGKRGEALAAVDRALRLSQALRTQTANPELRAQLQAPLRPAVDLKLDLLWEEFEAVGQAGAPRRAAEIAAVAFSAADAARAHSFGDIATADYTLAMRRALAPELARRERLYAELAARRFTFNDRQDTSGSADPRAQSIAGEIVELEREVDTVNNAIAARTIQASHASPGAPVTALRALLPADAALVAYWLGASSAYAWAVTPAGINWTRLSGPAVLTVTSRAFHDALSHLGAVPRERRIVTGAALYREIIAPVESYIEPYHRWIVIADGALGYIPFAALRSDATENGRFVASGHDVALAPAAWMITTARPTSKIADRVLVVSDPVYERRDPRLALVRAAGAVEDRVAATPGFARLPGTAREAAAITKEFAPGRVDALAGLAATRAALLALDWSRYRIIHVASHGIVDARMPQLSAVVLSSYGAGGERLEDAVRAADVSLLSLDAEVVVYSGCETALGREVLSEGMTGLGYTTLARGADAVVASLWPVPDEMGAELMTEFYRHLVRQSMSPTAALGAAMRSVLGRHPDADPALWAPFQVSVISLVDRDPRAAVAGASNVNHLKNRGPP